MQRWMRVFLKQYKYINGTDYKSGNMKWMQFLSTLQTDRGLASRILLASDTAAPRRKVTGVPSPPRARTRTSTVVHAAMANGRWSSGNRGG